MPALSSFQILPDPSSALTTYSAGDEGHGCQWTMEVPGGREPTAAEVPFVLRTGRLWGELHGVARADLVPQLGGTGAAGSKEMGGPRPGSGGERGSRGEASGRGPAQERPGSRPCVPERQVRAIFFLVTALLRYNSRAIDFTDFQCF